MAHMIVKDCFYDLSDKEVKAASLLSEGQIQWYKTQLHFARAELQNLVPTPNDYNSFVQKHAAVSGQISVYEFLLGNHEELVRNLDINNQVA